MIFFYNFSFCFFFWVLCGWVTKVSWLKGWQNIFNKCKKLWTYLNDRLRIVLRRASVDSKWSWRWWFSWPCSPFWCNKWVCEFAPSFSMLSELVRDAVLSKAAMSSIVVNSDGFYMFSEWHAWHDVDPNFTVLYSF